MLTFRAATQWDIRPVAGVLAEAIGWPEWKARVLAESRVKHVAPALDSDDGPAALEARAAAKSALRPREPPGKLRTTLALKSICWRSPVQVPA